MVTLLPHAMSENPKKRVQGSDPPKKAPSEFKGHKPPRILRYSREVRRIQEKALIWPLRWQVEEKSKKIY
ncbi:hypothetical protein AMTR_s00180p00022260 [Amborella trichopoda]|uniref:Uncharacterized protein n=1 Tax=Amborella trichopoda TaxID=13333 RepID=W1PZ39_AMBTC|nr:hypothetical protein AMTR_s00180p00022260 [Amborella trichopoda]